MSRKKTLAHFFDDILSYKMFADKPAAYLVPTRFANLSVLPSDPRLEDLQIKLESRYKMYKLREALDSLQGIRRRFHRHSARPELLHPFGADRR
jgi:hypothetical protein